MSKTIWRCFLEIKYKNNKLSRQCNDYSVAVKAYGKQMAQKIALRMIQLRAAEAVDELILASIGRCHSLKGDRIGEFAMDLVHPYRLVFVKENDVIELVKRRLSLK